MVVIEMHIRSVVAQLDPPAQLFVRYLLLDLQTLHTAPLPTFADELATRLHMLP
jgi:hypothetical protein